MISEQTKSELYDLAFRYKKTKLWERMYGDQLFAVSLEDGQIAYCSVMGILGEHVALGAYVGAEGYTTLNDISKGDRLGPGEEAVHLLLMHGQDCLQCAYDDEEYVSDEEIAEAKRFAKQFHTRNTGPFRYPHFVRYEPMLYPRSLEDETEAAHLKQCLKAAIYLYGRITSKGEDWMYVPESMNPGDKVPLLTETGPGEFAVSVTELPALVTPTLPDLKPADERTVAKVKKLRPSGTWECGLAYFPAFTEEHPRLYAALPVVGETRPRRIVPVTGIDADINVCYQQFLEGIIRYGKRPKALSVHPLDYRGRAFFGLLAEQLGIELELVRPLPQISDFICDYREAQREIPDEMMQSAMDEMYQFILEADELMLRMLPDELLGAFGLLLDAPDVPDEVKEKIRKLLRSR